MNRRRSTPYARSQAGFSLIEALLATTILVALFLAWGGAMIVATDGENKAATHTQVISSANEILEWMRRDPAFWGAEYTSGSCPHCWVGYNDTIGVSPPHRCSIVIANASANCSLTGWPWPTQNLARLRISPSKCITRAAITRPSVTS